jgi:hypothetical protein
MNPDLQHTIDTGKCIRTAYLTAGNAGAGLAYAKQREKGAEAAYTTLFRLPTNDWRRFYVRLNTQSVEVAVPTANTRASLLFYRLPDGGIKGNGYGPKGEPPRSLAGLLNGTKPTLTTVDARNIYTKEKLIASLAQVIARYKPVEIRTQGVLPDELAADHSDHYATGWIARQALALYRSQHPDTGTTISFYMGYPVIQREKNVSGDDLAAKEATFFAYGKFDDSVCRDLEACSHTQNAYIEYLPRMYTIPESEVASWPDSNQ